MEFILTLTLMGAFIFIMNARDKRKARRLRLEQNISEILRVVKNVPATPAHLRVYVTKVTKATENW